MTKQRIKCCGRHTVKNGDNTTDPWEIIFQMRMYFVVAENLTKQVKSECRPVSELFADLQKKIKSGLNLANFVLSEHHSHKGVTIIPSPPPPHTPLLASRLAGKGDQST